MQVKYLAKQGTAYGTSPHPWPFSHGAVVTRPEKLIILAGQCGFDRLGPNRKLVGEGDVEAQTRQVFESIKKLLTQEGATLRDVIDLTVYLVDVKDFPVCGRVAQEYFGDPPPVMTLIGVKSLALPEVLVEIRAIAIT